jgi:manganese oxidase
MGFAPNTPLEKTREIDFTNVLTNFQVGGDPVTPVFTATPGQEIHIRMLLPGGHPRNDNYMLHGHIWESQPYVDASQTIGSNPFSNWVGSQAGIGPGTHFDFIPKGGAGGRFRIPGDYLYRTFQSFHFDGGVWGILRVGPPPSSSNCPPCPKGMACPDVICPVTQTQ